MLYLFQADAPEHSEYEILKKRYPDKLILPLANKADLLTRDAFEKIKNLIPQAIPISAKTGQGVDELQKELLKLISIGNLGKGDICGFQQSTL